MDVDTVISFSDLAKEILKENGMQSEGQDEVVRVLRNKYAFLCNHVIMRSKLDFRLKGKDVIPLREKPIVKELIKRPYSPKSDEDKMIVDWFNNSIAANDYEKIRDLGSWIDSIISDELYNNNLDIDEVTRDPNPTENYCTNVRKNHNHRERCIGYSRSFRQAQCGVALPPQP